MPTLKELGYPGAEITGWQGVMVPAGTPPHVVASLNRAVRAALGARDLRATFISSGAEVGDDTPEAFAAFIREEHARWGRLIAQAGIKLQ